MNSCELVTFITSLACIISKECTSEELNILSSAFNQLGDSLGTISAHRDLCNTENSSMNNKSTTSDTE